MVIRCGLEQHQRHLTVQLLSRVRPFATPWTAACQASLSSAVSWSLLNVMFIESVILSHPLPPSSSILASIRILFTSYEETL